MKSFNKTIAKFGSVICSLICTCSTPVIAEQSIAVASAHPKATVAGIETLKSGGNAFDAAVAVAAALAVVEPYSTGLGGGGFWLLHIADEQRDTMIDGRERAPMRSTEDMFLDADGQPTDASINGPVAAGIPGVVASMEHIAKRYGTKPLAELLQPAIELAEQGYEVSDRYTYLALLRQSAIKSSPEAARIFFPDNRILSPGAVLIQKDLGATLRLIAEQGAQVFYQGKLADKLVKGVQASGGIWELEDLHSYRVVERTPLTTCYHGYEIVMAPLPSSGGVVISQSLAMLDRLNQTNTSPVLRVHQLIEVMRRAYQTRALYLGDADFTDMPLDNLLSDQYIENQIADYSASHATPSTTLPVSRPRSEGHDTTHFSIVDADGNYVAATLSINYPFGSGFVPPGTGVLLNDEMDDFAIAPAVPNAWGLVQSTANRIEPGKRMLSSMSPTFVRNQDRLLIVGTPGGSRIISMLLEAILGFVEGEGVSDIVAAPRFHHQYLPDIVEMEQGAVTDEQLDELKSLGHTLKVLPRTYGNMQAITLDFSNGITQAASDPRGHGAATVQPWK